MAAFAIHSLALGGGQLAITQMPGRQGDYRGDLGLLLAWGPALVITMTDLDELAAKGAASLGADLQAAGIGWRHLPVPDFGVPQDLDWPATRDEVLGLLARGARVLVHCHGGCGRSGMLCLRLMIAAGEAAAPALARLRALRPCAVETAAQKAWAEAG